MRSPGFSSRRLIFDIRTSCLWLWVCMIIAAEASQDLLPYIFFLFVSAQTQMFQMSSRGCRAGLPEQDMIYRSLSFDEFKPILSRYAVLRGHHAFVTRKGTPKNFHSPNVMHGAAALSGKPNTLLGSKIGCELKTWVELHPWKWGEIIAGVIHGADSVTARV